MPSRPELLCFGHDPLLNRTRRLILQPHFAVRSASHLPEAMALLAASRIDVILLCYSLSDEECQAVVDLVQNTQTRILALRQGGKGLALLPPHEEVFPEGPAELLGRLTALAGIMPAPELPSAVRRSKRQAPVSE